MTGIHQFVPTFEPGAVGAHALALREALRAAGHDSEVFAEHVHPAFEHHGALGHDTYGSGHPARAGDVLVYQMAIGSAVADFVAARREPLVVEHHNFTPVDLLAAWEPTATHGVAWGRAQLRALAARAALGIADSRFNERDLVAAGYARTEVLPVLVDVTRGPPSSDAPARGARPPVSGARWLFVGRLAPNKAQHRLVQALAVARRTLDPAATLVLVGGPERGRYRDAVAELVHELGLADAVTLTGPVDDVTLAEHYRAADVFVCLSEHEGFCVPVVEAMHHGVPVVALAATAVPETVGDAGVLVDRRDPLLVAAAADRVARDQGLRTELVARGRVRLHELDPARAARRRVELLEQVGAGGRA